MSEFPAHSSEASGNSPGAVLKRCREYHGFSLEEASTQTKIGISYIKALEEDQISEFANLAYLKGFLRIYAAYLGLNADDMGRMYDRLYGIKEGKGDAGNGADKQERPARRRLVPLRKLALPAVLLLLILIFATFFRRQPSYMRPSTPAVSPSRMSSVSAVQPKRSSATIRKTTPDTAKAPFESRQPPVAVSEKVIPIKKSADIIKSFILKIKVTQNGTLTATVDGTAPQAYDLTSGDIIEWKAEKSVALELSNAGGIDVELNGRPYKQLGPAGKPAFVVLDADGIKPDSR